MRRIVLFFLAATFVLTAAAQEAKLAPDVLVFTNGDQLTGHMERAAGGSVVFKSDMAGEVTVPFAKIKELRTGSGPNQFAVLRKGVRVTHNTPAPEGSISVADGNVRVTPNAPTGDASAAAEPAVIPAAQVDYVIARAEFDKQVHGRQPFLSGWNGTLTGGATVVRSTTSATTLTAGLSLVRAMPNVAWLPARDRTILNVNESYGRNTSPVIPPTIPASAAVVTLSSIFHADAERDQYFSPKLYALADTSFDHNYAQGLQLQQVYGGGIGWTPIKDAKQELDFKADLHYETQKYIMTPVNGAIVTPTTPTTNLIGSTFFEGYRRLMPRKMVFTESLNVLPAFNVASDYSANATAMLAIPVFKRLSASVSATDNFLDDPAPYYRKNSFQFVTGVTYTLH